MSDRKSFDEPKKAFLDLVNQKPVAPTPQNVQFKSAGLRKVQFNDKATLRSIHAGREDNGTTIKGTE